MASKHKVVAVGQHLQAKGLADALIHAKFTKAPSSRLYKVGSSEVSSRSLIQEVDKTDKMTRRKALTLMHRVAIYGAAVFFLKVSVSACIDIVHELKTAQSAMIVIAPIETLLLGKWVGTTTIRESPLLTELLGNNTAPRTETLYLDADATSLSGCTSTTAEIYGDSFQRQMFSNLVRDTTYSISFLSSLTAELILPVVDCTIDGADNTLLRLFYLMRSLNDTNNAYLVIVSMGIQDAKVAGKVGQGSAAVATIAAISDITATSIEHHFVLAKGYPYQAASFEVYKHLSTTSENMWQLQLVPSMASAVNSVITTAFRLGFYRGEESNQANIKNLVWKLPNNPLDFVKYLRLTGRPVLTNIWAWVHVIFFQLALDMFLKLYLINVLTVLYFKKRKIWIHDGFSAIATKLTFLAPVIVASWAMEGGWSLLELSIYDGNKITGLQSMTIHESIIRADLLVLCYSIAAMIGNLTKTRIDPFVATLAFYLVFDQRHAIIQWFPSLKAYVTTYSNQNYELGKDLTENVALISPLAHWGIHKITSFPVKVVCATVGTIVGPYVIIILIYMVLHKIYRWYFPEQIQVIRNTNRSLHEDDMLQQRRTQTIFEIATGAQLLDRYGLISDYQNYIYVRGVKFATTDGIYASGFAIANDKYVLQAHDLRMIWLMRATGIRLKDIYAYPLAGKTVQQTARLVYPDTLSTEDLAKISGAVAPVSHLPSTEEMSRLVTSKATLVSVRHQPVPQISGNPEVETFSTPDSHVTHKIGVINALFRYQSRAAMYKTQRSSASSRHLSSKTMVQELKKTDELTWWKALHLLHRVAIFGAAIMLLQICIAACIDILRELQATQNASLNVVPYETLLMDQYVGTSTIRKSPIVLDLLGNDTSVRNDTLYLDISSTSFSHCSSVELPDKLYANDFQRQVYSVLARDTSYNITFLDSTKAELILPIVDCSSSSIAYEDNTAVRLFYLMRNKTDTNDVFLVAIAMSMQDYFVVGQSSQGPAAVANIARISDLTATSVDHMFALSAGYPYEALSFVVYELVGVTSESYWQLKRVASQSSAVSYSVTTACRTGFYVSDETSQCNIKNLIWKLSNDPIEVVSYWRWLGRPVLRNSWAWVHGVYFLLTFELSFKLLLLVLTTIKHTGKKAFWIGDAFSSIATIIPILGPIVIVSWALEKGWTLMELGLVEGNKIADTQGMYMHSGIVKADLLALCLSLAGFLGVLFKERIDPVVCMAAFTEVFSYRLKLIEWIPVLSSYITAYTKADYSLAMDSTENVSLVSPNAHWSSHELTSRPIGFMLASICMVVGPFLAVMLVYIAVRKVYWHFFPERILVMRATDRSMNESELLELRRSITIFEFATGAQLQNHFGVLSDYNNYLYVRGVKFATSDGIYSSGFVVVNEKFVMQLKDLRAVWLMKFLRVRLTDVYAYQLTGKTVQKTSQLVYPSTFSFQDLVNVSISKLA